MKPVTVVRLDPPLRGIIRRFDHVLPAVSAKVTGQIYVKSSKKDHKDCGFLFVIGNTLVAGVFDGVSVSSSTGADIKKIRDTLLLYLENFSHGLISESKSDVVNSILSQVARQIPQGIQTTLSLVILSKEDSYWSGSSFVFGDSPVFLFGKNNSGSFDSRVYVEQKPTILQIHMQDRSTIHTDFSMACVNCGIVGSFRLERGSHILVATDGLSDNFEVVSRLMVPTVPITQDTPRNLGDLNLYEVIDPFGSIELKRLLSEGKLSLNTLFRLASSRIKKNEIHHNYHFDPNDKTNVTITTVLPKSDESATGILIECL